MDHIAFQTAALVMTTNLHARTAFSSSLDAVLIRQTLPKCLIRTNSTFYT